MSLWWTESNNVSFEWIAPGQQAHDGQTPYAGDGALLLVGPDGDGLAIQGKPEQVYRELVRAISLMLGVMDKSEPDPRQTFRIAVDTDGERLRTYEVLATTATHAIEAVIERVDSLRSVTVDHRDDYPPDDSFEVPLEGPTP